MQAINNIFSVFARPFHLVDGRSLKRGLALCAIGAFFIATLVAFAMSASLGGGVGNGVTGGIADKVGFQPGQEIANLMYRGHIGQ